MTKQAAIERALKLLRLAAPTSGTTEPERISAALECAKLIAEHDLIVVERPAPLPRARPPQPAHQNTDWMTRARSASAAAAAAREEEDILRRTDNGGFYAETRRRKKAPRPFSTPDWNEIQTDRFVLCIACGNGIFAGERCWYDPKRGFRHYSISCETD